MKLDVPLQVRVGGMAVILVGVAMVLISGLSWLQAKAAVSWPAVDARVTRSEVAVTKKAGGIRRGQAVQSDYFTATVRYDYVVNGRTFTGSRITLDESDTSGYARADAEKWVKQYPVGTTLRIHHAPDQPQLSVIDPAPNAFFLAVIFVLGKLAVLGGIGVFRVGCQMQPATEEPAPVLAAEAQPVLQPERQTHWSIRSIAVVTGLVFFFIGALPLPISVRQYSQAISAEEANHAVQIVTITMMTGVMFFGAFLVWYPLRRTPPTLAVAPAPSRP